MARHNKGKKSPARPAAIDNSHLAEIDYTPLEYLLACLIDGHASEFKPRSGRIRDAHKEVTGTVVKRIDDPDSPLSQNLFRAFLNKLKNMDEQLNEAHGGPVVVTEADKLRYAEKEDYELAKEIYEEGSEELDAFYRRMCGTYGAVRKFDRAGYVDSLLRWAWHYDEAKERALYEDMKKIAEILAKHSVPMNLDRPFWRITAKP